MHDVGKDGNWFVVTYRYWCFNPRCEVVKTRLVSISQNANPTEQFSRLSNAAQQKLKVGNTSIGENEKESAQFIKRLLKGGCSFLITAKR